MPMEKFPDSLIKLQVFWDVELGLELPQILKYLALLINSADVKHEVILFICVIKHLISLEKDFFLNMADFSSLESRV